MAEVMTSFEDVVEELEATRGKRVRVGIEDLNCILLVAGWEEPLESVQIESEAECKLGFGGDGGSFLRIAADACDYIEVRSGAGITARQGNLEIYIDRL